ncbi:MAG: right-handed parallel beta-helix repeat-containing protein, partial [Acidobacteriota bacterium]|nr:right-handed parallel beta-helix repeat-containing protein [Acidobacteriota bacterium]
LHISGGDIGIRIQDANVTIERVEITGTKLAAIEFSGASSGVVEASFLHDNSGAGIVVKEPARPVLIGNNVVESGAKTGKR